MKRHVWFTSSIGVGITMFLVGLLFHVLSPVIAPGLEVHYKNRDLFRNWNGWTSTYMLMHPFLYAPVFSAGFSYLHRISKLPSGVGNGLAYGAIVFCVGSLPVFLLMFASLQLPPEVIAAWMLQNLFQYLAAGLALCVVTDGMPLRVSRQLPAAADHVWALLLRKDTFLYLTRHWLEVADTNKWPETFFTPGISYQMRFRLFGRGPLLAHTACVTRVDANTMTIETEERGGLVTAWNHRMQVENVSCNRSQYTDFVQLKAGLLTPFVWLFARGFYLARQRRWMKLLNERMQVDQNEIDETKRY
jgi:ligand-binding SRPBCC domain-containing protein